MTDKVGRLFKLTLECEWISPLGTRNVDFLKQNAKAEKAVSFKGLI